MYIEILKFRSTTRNYHRPIESFIELNYQCLLSSMNRTGNQGQDEASLKKCPLDPLFYHNFYNIFQFYRAISSVKNKEDQIKQLLGTKQYSRSESGP